MPSLQSLVNAVKIHGPDTVHINNWTRLRSKTVRKIFLNYPTVHTVHDYFITDPKGICAV